MKIEIDLEYYTLLFQPFKNPPAATAALRGIVVKNKLKQGNENEN